MRLQTATLQFLGNELQLEPANISPDTLFADLGLNPAQLTDLLQRLQDALTIVLPEDRIAGITTVGDLLEAVAEQEE